MKKIVALLSALAFMASCAPNFYRPKLTSPQREYLSSAMAQPTSFYVKKDQSDATWGRMQSFIAQASPAKIQVATDYVIQTYNPNALVGTWCGYSATRAPLGDSVKFNIQCINSIVNDGSDAGMYLDSAVHRNAHLCAYYAVTGKETPAILIQ